MPTVIAGWIKMDPQEKDLIADLVCQPINPKTVDEYNAWIDVATQEIEDDPPEYKLLRAMVAELRVADGKSTKCFYSRPKTEGAVIRHPRNKH